MFNRVLYRLNRYLFKVNSKCSCVFIVNIEEEFAHTHQTITCAKSIKEKLGKGVKYVQN